ncbi:MAG: sensor domain-containing diguanylate cyclase [Candidatus Methylomirabilales bacterium]
MGSWKQHIPRSLRSFHLHSIKSRILAFALLATLIPSLTMGWLSYKHNRELLAEKTSGELRNITSHAAREIDIWLKERLYELRVFASSYEVSENLEKMLRAHGPPVTEGLASRRLKDYLTSVREKFVHYEALVVIDAGARVVATSAGQAGPLNLPPDWVKMANRDKAILGDTVWDGVRRKTTMTIAVPIRAANGHLLGAMAARLNFRTIDETFRGFSLGETGQAYLMAADGTLVLSSRPLSPPFDTATPTYQVPQALLEMESVLLEYRDHRGKDMVGTLKRLPQLNWAVVAEVERSEVYASIIQLRNLTFLMVAGLLLGIGLTAYLLGLTIVRSLNRLTEGAAKVAAGDLEVDLPVASRGELGYLTEVFNYMVARLRQGREELDAINKTLSEKNRELERLSVTDGLTGLYNRSHLMQTLANETARAQRHRRPFSVLMIDIDHFKRYNDSFGHLAGDALLSKLASVFTKSIRTVEYAARYGGEEFLIMLPETEPDGAVDAAERIRAQVAKGTSGDGNAGQGVTVSIGVAGFPEHGDTPEKIIASADAALYQAKRDGRDRVIRAGGSPGKGIKGRGRPKEPVKH